MGDPQLLVQRPSESQSSCSLLLTTFLVIADLLQECLCVNALFVMLWPALSSNQQLL